VPPDDIFNDRPDRDSAIDIKSVREAVEAQGFAGPFRDREFSIDWWGRRDDEVLRTRFARHLSVVQMRRSEMLC
jgi:hypothetical protein